MSWMLPRRARPLVLDDFCRCVALSTHRQCGRRRACCCRRGIEGCARTIAWSEDVVDGASGDARMRCRLARHRLAQQILTQQTDREQEQRNATANCQLRTLIMSSSVCLCALFWRCRSSHISADIHHVRDEVAGETAADGLAALLLPSATHHRKQSRGQSESAADRDRLIAELC